MREYKMVRGDCADSLSRDVTRLLSEGWILYGYPTVLKPEKYPSYFQAMVLPLRVLELRRRSTSQTYEPAASITTDTTDPTVTKAAQCASSRPRKSQAGSARKRFT